MKTLNFGLILAGVGGEKSHQGPDLNEFQPCSIFPRWLSRPYANMFLVTHRSPPHE